MTRLLIVLYRKVGWSGTVLQQGSKQTYSLYGACISGKTHSLIAASKSAVGNFSNTETINFIRSFNGVFRFSNNPEKLIGVSHSSTLSVLKSEQYRRSNFVISSRYSDDNSRPSSAFRRSNSISRSETRFLMVSTSLLLYEASAFSSFNGNL